MNNAILTDLEPELVNEDKTPLLRQRETELAMMIEALEKLASSTEWINLKKLLFDGVVENLEVMLKREATKSILNDPEIYRLNGQLIWARKYADLNKLSTVYRTELANVKKLLKNTDGQNY